MTRRRQKHMEPAHRSFGFSETKSTTHAVRCQGSRRLDSRDHKADGERALLPQCVAPNTPISEPGFRNTEEMR